MSQSKSKSIFLQHLASWPTFLMRTTCFVCAHLEMS